MSISLLQKGGSSMPGLPLYPATASWHFPAATTAGSLLLCAVWGSILDTVSAADPVVIQTPLTAGLTWTLAATINFDNQFSNNAFAYEADTLSVYYCDNAPSIASTVNTEFSMSYPSTPNDDWGGLFNLYEFGGFPGSVDVTIVSNSGSASPVTAGDIDGSELIVVFGTQTVSVAGSGYTLLQTYLNQEFGQYRANDPPATYSTAFTSGNYGSDVPFLCVAVAFGAGPGVTGITPDSGPTTGGQLVAITGAGFVSGALVTFCDTPATDVTIGSSTTLFAVTPPNAEGPCDVCIILPSGTFCFANGYTYIPGVAGGGGGGGGEGTGPPSPGVAQCTHAVLLNTIPGFSDLPNSVLAADNPSFALHLGEISFNAAFGMVRCEVFPGLLQHGDTVPLPVSCLDGYVYAREELLYCWTVTTSCDPSTNWISGPDSLWFSNWNVDQSTGEVFSEEWYQRSSTADSRLSAKSNDGQLLVFTIGQRQKTNMIMAVPASYEAIDESSISTDKPLTQDLVQHLNDDAKFSVVNSEIFYLGEYVDGDTVTLPTSPVDGYTYTAAECKFTHSWRWTASGAAYIQPPWGGAGPYCDQLGPFLAAVSSVGVCSITVNYIYNGGESLNAAPGFGRIAVFAFAKRSATPSSMSLADNFTELDVGFFFPGEDLRASTVLAIKRNIDEAMLSPEFFGPTEYHHADTVPLPVSAVDGYTYTRAECQYVWSWSDTHNSSAIPRLRIPLFLGSIAQATGLVTLNVWRLPPGGPYEDNDNTVATIRVIVVGNRQSHHPEIVDTTLLGSPSGTAGSYSSDHSSTLINGV